MRVSDLAEFLGCDFMAFFTTYADESYAKADGAYVDHPFVIAGFVGPAKTWKQFEREWKRLLKHEGLPYFHMSDCEGGYTDVFKHLNLKTAAGRAERDRLQRVFIEAINRYEIYGVAGGIPQRHFSMVYDALSQYMDLHPGGDGETLTPYLFAFETCLNAIFGLLKGHDDKQVAFIFDEQNEHEASAQKARARLASNASYQHASMVGPLTYCNKKNAIPLQAADILAYEVMREMRDPDMKRWQRKLLDKRRRVSAEYFRADMVASLVADIHATAAVNSRRDATSETDESVH